MEDLSKKSDEELEAIRENSAENSYVPSSIFHRAGREIERRHRKRMEEKNQTTIHAAIVSNGADAQFIGNTFIGEINSKQEKRWWESDLFQWVILFGALAGIYGVYLFFQDKSTHTKETPSLMISTSTITSSIVTLGQTGGTNTIVTAIPPKVLKQEEVSHDIEVSGRYLQTFKLLTQGTTDQTKLLLISPDIKMQDGNFSKGQMVMMAADNGIPGGTYQEYDVTFFTTSKIGNQEFTFDLR